MCEPQILLTGRKIIVVTHKSWCRSINITHSDPYAGTRNTSRIFFCMARWCTLPNT